MMEVAPSRDEILEFLDGGRQERERTAMTASELYSEVLRMRSELKNLEERYDNSIDEALAAGWDSPDLVALGISEEPKTIAARKRRRAAKDQ